MIIKLLEKESIRRVARYSIIFIFLILLILVFLTDVNVRKDDEYVDSKHVKLYVIKYNDVPDNYVLKSQSYLLEGEELTLYDAFRNDEGLLPTGSYTEVYINAYKGDAGSERIVYSSNQVYLTEDHYQSFEELNRFDILGWHYFFIGIFVAQLSGIGITLYILIEKKKIISWIIIKTDFINDWKIITNYGKSGTKKIANKISEIANK